MANYLIGDIQGCYHDLIQILHQAEFNPNLDHLYIAGDLVARGEDSLSVLRYLYQLGEHAHIVLGNHDLHLLAVAEGIRPSKAKDKITPILEADDKAILLNWLRHQPLLIHNKQAGPLNSQGFVMTHAGIPPCWDLKQAKDCAQEVEKDLRSPHYLQLLKQMYADEPRLWSDDLTKFERLRFIINALTRMRFLEKDMSLEMNCKLPPDQIAETFLVPWFKHTKRKSIDETLVFGHWAALGGIQTPKLIGLDTGCVWGGHLTMLRWEDGARFTQKSSILA